MTQTPQDPHATVRRRINWKSVSLGLAVYSLVLTAAIAVWVLKKGGPRYVLEQLGLVRYTLVPQDWQVDWVERYKAFPNTEGEVVFAGDSITAGAPWGEYYSDIRNRGIGGDTSDGLLRRVGEITESHPKQIFINIGTNDLAKECPSEQVVENIQQLVARIKGASPSTEVYVLSVLPINLDMSRSLQTEWKLRETSRLNGELRRAQGPSGFRFLDMTPAFSDKRGYLRRDLTSDGLHLNDAGARLLCETLRPHVRSRELEARRPPGRSRDL